MEDTQEKKGKNKESNPESPSVVKKRSKGEIGVEELTCRNCVYEAEQPTILRNHLKEKHNQPSDTFECLICRYEAQSQPKLNQHTEENHLNGRVDINKPRLNVSCEKCDYKCKFNIQLKKHRKTHHEESGNAGYSCQSCSFKSYLLTDMWSHKISNHPEENNQFNSISKKSPTDLILNFLAEQNADIQELVSDLNKGFRELLNNSVMIFNQVLTRLKNHSCRNVLPT